ncbi:MAG: HAD family hydrolase [Planctomycetota bacterium]
MTHPHLAPILANRSPLSPIPTETEPRLSKLTDVLAVIFDVYGTLVISGSGDVGTADDRGGTEADTDPVISAAALSAGLVADGDRNAIVRLPRRQDLLEAIVNSNTASKSDANTKPEVVILDVWREVFESRGLGSAAFDVAALTRFACDVESRWNPTWPMPGAGEAIASLAEAGHLLGIVSNAQIFTLPLIEDLAGGALSDRFDLNLCFFSDRFRSAKPDSRLFDHLIGALDRCGIAPSQAVYVGNDMLNDVWTARQAGLRTILFAADRRSLRLRESVATCKNLEPDVVVSSWRDVVECLRSG